MIKSPFCRRPPGPPAKLPVFFHLVFYRLCFDAPLLTQGITFETPGLQPAERKAASPFDEVAALAISETKRTRSFIFLGLEKWYWPKGYQVLISDDALVSGGIAMAGNT
jgi:hypothetical protein